MTNNEINLFKKCFKQISINELKNRIDQYREVVNLKTISEENLRQKLKKLFYIEINGKGFSFFIKSDTMSQQYQNWHFYRIRKFEKEDYFGINNKKFTSIQKEQDIWAPPESLVKKLGRLNKVGESMLYAAAQTTNAIYETSCQENDFFFLFVYKNMKQMRLSQIHVNPIAKEFNALENSKQQILHNFLLGEFTKIVSFGEEYNYKSSIAIFNEFFNSPQIDGFTYPSVKTDRNLGFNICFSARKARENLKFCGLMVCKLGPFRPETGFQLHPIYDGFLNVDGSFDFHNYNSNTAREKFGNFCLIRDMGL